MLTIKKEQNGTKLYLRRVTANNLSYIMLTTEVLSAPHLLSFKEDIVQKMGYINPQLNLLLGPNQRLYMRNE